MRHSLLLLILCSLFCFGCASMKHNYTPDVKQMDFPKQNTETTVYMGEEMLIQGTVAEQQALHNKDLIDGACYDIPQGFYIKTGYDNKKEYFSYVGSNAQVDRSGLCDPISGLYVPIGKKEICVITIFGGISCYDGNFEIKNIKIASADHIQKSLIFSGKDGDIAKFMYVEKSGTQTGLTHNVTYNLKDTNIIGYRGARIKILNCTNESISYIVMQNFPNRIQE